MEYDLTCSETRRGAFSYSNKREDKWQKKTNNDQEHLITKR